MINNLIAEILREDITHLKSINQSHILDPVKKSIVKCAIHLVNKGLPTNRSYIVDAFEKVKKNTKALNAVLDEIETCQIPSYGDISKELRDEYILDNLSLVKSQIEATKEPMIKLSVIANLIKSLEVSADDNFTFSVKEEMEKYVNEYGKVKDSNGEMKVYYPPLQKLFGEKIRPFLYVIGGRPARGKTTLLRELECDWMRHGHRGLAFSLEDNKDAFTIKMMAPFYGVTKNDLWTEQINQPKFEYLKTIKPEGDITIIDKFVDRFELATIVEKHHKNIDWISLDYLQIIDRAGGKTHEEIALFTKEIMRICKVYKKPFIALTQLNRGIEGSDGREPQLSDIKDSGSIEQDARFIIALWDDNATVLKNTWGTLQTVSLDWNMAMGRLQGVGGYTKPEKKERKSKKFEDTF